MTDQIALRACTDADWPAVNETMTTAFGSALTPEADANWRQVMDSKNLIVATDCQDGPEVVAGTAGWLPFGMTVPGGEITVAGVTMVTVRPTHRRRGILRRMMRHQFEDVRARGIVGATLWASESSIYPRFGYGLAHVKGRIEIEPRRASLVGRPEAVGRARLVSTEQALALIPPVYERVRREIPGSYGRSEPWWVAIKLSDIPAHRGGGGPLQRMVLEIDGAVEGYALYRVFPNYGPDTLPTHVLEVLEALGTSPTATREVWRYLFSVDLIARVRSNRLVGDHPLLWMLDDPRQLRMTVGDGTYLRLVDVVEALPRRRYQSEDSLTFELADADCPWNAGVWTLSASRDGTEVRRATATPQLRLSATELASMYLGTVRCTSLLRAGRVEELAPGAASRADVLFRSDVAPWCLDDF